MDIRALAAMLRQKTAWQRLPESLSESDYCFLILEALRDLFVMTGRAVTFDPNAVTYEAGMPVSYARDFQLDETEYVLVAAEIALLQKAQMDVNNIVGYTTDALSVTNADKPYQYLGATIKELETKRRVIYYKMSRFNTL